LLPLVLLLFFLSDGLRQISVAAADERRPPKNSVSWKIAADNQRQPEEKD
jgi:hypothetical protein